MGLFKKAMELSILCDCDVALVVVNKNKLFSYSSDDIDAVWTRFDAMRTKDTHTLSNEHYAEVAKGSTAVVAGAEVGELEDEEETSYAAKSRRKRSNSAPAEKAGAKASSQGAKSASRAQKSAEETDEDDYDVDPTSRANGKTAERSKTNKKRKAGEASETPGTPATKRKLDALASAAMDEMGASKSKGTPKKKHSE